MAFFVVIIAAVVVFVVVDKSRKEKRDAEIRLKIQIYAIALWAARNV